MAASSAEGLELIERPAVAAIGEIFEQPDSVRPRVAALWGPRGAGKDTAVAALARLARLQGFIPIASRLVSAFADVLRGRSLFVIAEGDQREGWSVLLHAAAGSCRPHVLLFVGQEESCSLDSVGLAPLSADRLVRAVRTGAASARRDLAIRRMAAQSRGWPGRFARLLWRGIDTPLLDRADGDRECGRVPRAAARGDAVSTATGDTGGRRRIVRAAEPSVVYGVVSPGGTGVDTGEGAPPDDVAALRRRIEIGRHLIAQGRHAPGERVMRQAIGGLARRQDWRHAGDATAALAGLLLRRGRARIAQGVLKSAADYGRRANDEPRLIDVAILAGGAATDLARVDEAETTLSTAVAAARALGDRVRTGRALAALARTLFWRGQYEAADQALVSIDRAALGDRGVPAVEGLRSSVAVGLRRLDRAVAHAAEAAARARHSGDAGLVAEAARRAAFAHLAVGDTAAVDRDAAESIAAARAAREPLLAARVRLMLVEVLRRSGHKPAAARLLRRITRLGDSTLPPILTAHGELCRDLLFREDVASEVVARHVAATGLGGLALFGPPPAPTACQDVMVDHIVAVLDLCQTSDDDPALLTQVCRLVRHRLKAAATAIAVPKGQGWTVMASDGGRIDAALADRAAGSGITIPPHRRDDRIEAAAPIRYGGATIGALVARWTVGTLHDLSAAPSVLATTAAAAAPMVSAAIARTRAVSGVSMPDLLGATPVMADVRHGVERAAPAPFAVLIEGESGTGKELVARAIHRASPRRDRAFCTLNCAALPDDLVEAELFGHARGAFTGAIAERTGVFEEAHGGTLMLDEIGELSPRAQAKLLRVIQEGELRRIGDNVSRRVDVRIVSATNRDLRREVAAGRFRLDLLYRLDVLRIVVPPLRERREDIPALAEHFWREASARVGSRASLAAPTLAALARYDWPGNVRELQNVLASLAVRSPKRGAVPPTALGPQFGDSCAAEEARLDAARRLFEERFVRAALVRTGGHRLRAARELGVSRQGLAKLMSRLRIATP